MALQLALHVTGSYSTGGKSSLSLSGVYSAEMGTTVLVASIRLDGHAFQDNRMPEGVSGCELFVGVAFDTDHLDPRHLQSCSRPS